MITNISKKLLLYPSWNISLKKSLIKKILRKIPYKILPEILFSQQKKKIKPYETCLQY